jgi:hypothetical protein
VRREKSLQGIGGLFDDGAAFGQRAVIERQIFADGIVEFRVRKPRETVVGHRQSRIFLEMKGQGNRIIVGGEIVIDLGKQAGAHQRVGGVLEFRTADLRARGQA